MKDHIKTVHEEQSNYKCISCGKSFTQLGSLKIHIKIVHEGQKGHKCEFCDRSFKMARHLKAHIKAIHDGCKDHNCNICSKSFSVKAASIDATYEKCSFKGKLNRYLYLPRS